MHYTVTTKHFHIANKDLIHLTKLLKKVLGMVQWRELDYPLVDIVLRMQKKRSRNYMEKKFTSELIVQPLREHKIIDNPVYYDGTIKLLLPKKPLVVHILGIQVDEALNAGFDHLFRELATYKGHHFGDYSEYFDHRTIRRQ